LVMKEVLSRLIGSSFKSGAVLKKLEIGTRRPRPKYWVETMKGKSRVLLLQSDVEIPSLASQVAPFCREVCQKLSCCPYLFGPQLVGEECPSACNSRPKSDFHTVEGDGRPRRGVKRRRRGGRGGGGVDTGGQQTPGAGAQSPCQSSSGSSPSASPTPSTTVTTCTTRESSPTHNTEQQQQLAVKPSSKDKETLERILAEKCREGELTGSREISPPPRLPSPKLLRSKSLGSGGSLSFSGGLGEAGLAPRIVELSRRGGLQPAFNVDFSTPCPDMEDPPPVRRLVLKSNPLFWNKGGGQIYWPAGGCGSTLGIIPQGRSRRTGVTAP